MSHCALTPKSRRCIWVPWQGGPGGNSTVGRFLNDSARLPNRVPGKRRLQTAQGPWGDTGARPASAPASAPARLLSAWGVGAVVVPSVQVRPLRGWCGCSATVAKYHGWGLANGGLERSQTRSWTSRIKVTADSGEAPPPVSQTHLLTVTSHDRGASEGVSGPHYRHSFHHGGSTFVTSLTATPSPWG